MNNSESRAFQSSASQTLYQFDQEFMATRARRTTAVTARSTSGFDSEMLFKGCGAAIIGLALDGTIIAWNPGAERLYGYSATVMLGKSILVLSPANRPADLAEALEEVRAARALEPQEMVHLKQNGTQIEVLLNLSPLYAPGGAVMGVAMVAQDISSKKREEHERLELIRELTRALSSLSRSKLIKESKTSVGQGS